MTTNFIKSNAVAVFAVAAVKYRVRNSLIFSHSRPPQNVVVVQERSGNDEKECCTCEIVVLFINMYLVTFSLRRRLW